jgi:hypothetical protein
MQAAHATQPDAFTTWTITLAHASASELVHLVLANRPGTDISDAAFTVLERRYGFGRTHRLLDAERKARLEEWGQHMAEAARQAIQEASL